VLNGFDGSLVSFRREGDLPDAELVDPFVDAPVTMAPTFAPALRPPHVQRRLELPGLGIGLCEDSFRRLNLPWRATLEEPLCAMFLLCPEIR